MTSIRKTEQEEKILKLCEMYLEPQGFRAVDVDCHIGRQSVIRVFVERGRRTASNELTASLEDCAEASRILDGVLETEELVPGPYELEVSSPGLNRRLREPVDFERVVGQEVKLQLAESLSPTETILGMTGRLLRVEGENLLVKYHGAEMVVPIRIIKRATRIWKF